MEHIVFLICNTTLNFLYDLKTNYKSMLFGTQCIEMGTDPSKWKLFITVKCLAHIPDEWNWLCGGLPQSRAGTPEHIPFSLSSWSILTPLTARNIFAREKNSKESKSKFLFEERELSRYFQGVSVLKKEQLQRDFQKNGMPEKPFTYCHLCSNRCSCPRLILSGPPSQEHN